MFRVHDSYHFYDNTGSLGYVLYHALPPGGLYAINLANLSIENVCRMSKLAQAFEGLLGTKQDILASFPALLGNGQGMVDVPGEPNKVYVRVAGQVQEVRCTRLTVRIDWLPIIVGTTAEEPNSPRCFRLTWGC